MILSFHALLQHMHHMISPDPLHGRVGTDAVCATMELEILSPSDHIALEGGPRNVMLYLWRSSGSFGFSEACPHPAHTAWTSTLRAMSRMRSTLA